MFFNIFAIKKIMEEMEVKDEVYIDTVVKDTQIIDKEKLINESMWVVNNEVYKFCTESYYPNIGKEDVYQVCCLGLVKAANAFDPERGTKFTTFATQVVQNELYKELRRGYIKEKWSDCPEEFQEQYFMTSTFADDSDAEYYYASQLEIHKNEAKQKTIKRGIEIIQLKCNNYSKNEILDELNITEFIYKKCLLVARKYLRTKLSY